VQDLFGESGEPVELFDQHGISGKKIAERVLGISV
jgi:transketolase C-terminal domain/subunit